MLATIHSAAVIGVEAFDVLVEVDITPGLPAWTIVGLPSGSVREARERVGAALVNAGFSAPNKRVTVNLSPADQRKDGTAFDLPIALGVLVATGQLPAAAVEGIVAVGELGLDGALRAVRGALPMAQHAALRGSRALLLPSVNGHEAALAGRARLAIADTLGEAVTALRTGTLQGPTTSRVIDAPRTGDDLADVAGQPLAKRALEIAAAGGHNLLLVGPPGAGTTMLARRLAGLLPPLDDAAFLEVVAVQSVGGIVPVGQVPRRTPPFRAPHHTISIAGLIGGGPGPRPGEVSLAHHGVLFLDELLELPRYVLDAMRQPLEDRRVVLARAAHAVTYPARFLLVAATNPCPCGRALSGDASCTCSAAAIERYRSRLSGPLADRIDLHVTVGAVAVQELAAAGAAERSDVVRARVAVARERQA
ncbi:MAG: YifB family Mg chelatase-like AAA ATPase, partial [Gemmatimonadaceae bacterium]|nr:YifB family Mg chelatase-like AAA ATPase [Gemmatimonadaceae bacterium]